jgi:DNA uptake protein ComE-like DNA-binding protein
MELFVLRVVRVSTSCGQYHMHSLANNVGVVKSTMGIEDQVQESSYKGGKTGLNQSLIYIHPFFLTVTQVLFFWPSSTRYPKKKKNVLGSKDIGGAFVPTHQS